MSAVKCLGLDQNSHVVELAFNDGYLLQYVQKGGVSRLRIEPTKAPAEAARLKELSTLELFVALAEDQPVRHDHYSDLSLQAVDRIAVKVGFKVVDVE